MQLRPIAHYQGDFPEKFGILRQSGLSDTKGILVFTKEFSDPDFLRNLEEYSHIWLIWGFSQRETEQLSPTVRPPRLGGNKRIGVFASRSPNRPNPLGLSVVTLEQIEYTKEHKLLLHISGADLMNNTPIYDIKPYLPYADSIANASAGMFTFAPQASLQVEIPTELFQKIPTEKQLTLQTVLSHDPRPSYQNDPKRVYYMQFAGFEIQFQVRDDVLHVLDIVLK